MGMGGEEEVRLTRSQRRRAKAWPRIMAGGLVVLVLGFFVIHRGPRHHHHHAKPGEVTRFYHEVEFLVFAFGVLLLGLLAVWQWFWGPVTVYNRHLQTGDALPHGFMRWTAGRTKPFGKGT